LSNIFPSKIPLEIKNDSKREGEIIVFEILKKLTDDYQIYYSVDWTRKKKGFNDQDGECDFIIIHKLLGIVCVEVKGGKVFKEIENGKGVFYSKDKNGSTHKIKNPYKQAKKTKYLLLDYWKNNIKNPPWINIKHAVIFPETNKPDKLLTLNEHESITLYKEDLLKIKSKIVALFTIDYNEVIYEFKNDDMSFFKDLFLSKIPLKEKLNEIIEFQSKDLENKTAVFINNLLIGMDGLHNKLSFQGGAGTGKTYIALEFAKRFNEKNSNVLFLCFNNGLKNFLCNQLSNMKFIKVMTINEYIFSLNINILDQENIETEILKQSSFFQNIIIDESQDFKNEWWKIVELSLEKQSSNMLIFNDNNQKIYKDVFQDNNFFNDFKKIELNQNFRNTLNIHLLVRNYYNGHSYKSNSIRGEKIKFLEEDSENYDELLNNLLENLIIENDISLEKISILNCDTVKSDDYAKFNSKIKFNLKKCDSNISNAITYDSVYRYKGLENDVVIIINLSNKSNNIELLYTALSRAKIMLYVVDNSNIIKLLKNLIQL
jgi:hypothetical protein